MNLLEHLAAVAVLHDPDAAPRDVPHGLLRLLEDGLGKHGGAGAEIEDAVGHEWLEVRVDLVVRLAPVFPSS